MKCGQWQVWVGVGQCDCVSGLGQNTPPPFLAARGYRVYRVLAMTHKRVRSSHNNSDGIFLSKPRTKILDINPMYG